MSTILRAYDRRHENPDAGNDPDLILERNAALREDLRHRSGRTGRERVKVILSGICLGLAIAAVLVMAAIMMKSPGEATDAESHAAVPSPAGTPAPSPVVTPTPSLPPPTPSEASRQPVIRESVRLRPRPLLKPAPEHPSYSTDRTNLRLAVSPPQAATPAPAPSPTPGVSPAPPPQNPTPSPTPDDPEAFLVLTGVIDDSNNPTALINGRAVGIGGVILGAKVLAIDNRSSVRVEYKGKEYTIRIK